MTIRTKWVYSDICVIKSSRWPTLGHNVYFESQGPFWVTWSPFFRHTGKRWWSILGHMVHFMSHGPLFVSYSGWNATWGRSLVQLRRTRRIGLCGKIAPWQQLPAMCDQHKLVAITQNQEENSIGPDLTKWHEARYGESSSPSVPTIPYYTYCL